MFHLPNPTEKIMANHPLLIVNRDDNARSICDQCLTNRNSWLVTSNRYKYRCNKNAVKWPFLKSHFILWHLNKAVKFLLLWPIAGCWWERTSMVPFLNIPYLDRGRHFMIGTVSYFEYIRLLQMHGIFTVFLSQCVFGVKQH